MDDMVGSEGLERLGDRSAVANVDLSEAVVRRIVDHGQGLQIAGVGERVEVEHGGAVGHQAPAYGRADESRAAGHKHFSLHEDLSMNFELQSSAWAAAVPAIMTKGGRNNSLPTGAIRAA